MSIRVFIADDHELVRYAMRNVLEGESDIEIVGEAGDTASAIDGCADIKPDVLLLDLHMPGGGGVEVSRAVTQKCPETRVLVLTSFDEDEELFGVLSSGASGYLLKDTRPERIVQAIRSVAEGQAVFDAAVADRVINRGNHIESDSEESLSDREMEVLHLMAQGQSNKEIARALWISETTVKSHVSHILRKTGQGDRTQAVLHAVKSGLVELNR